ncbi:MULTISPECIES: FtsL-like putative cell division protein [unclassified Carboxylicivirga]|uniref:FtsL-like putative cell division protein n=1 Tax=Carboxylicivirga TaxID=1628153 RepID=UPI003D3279A7
MKLKMDKIPDFILSKEEVDELKNISVRELINGRLFTRSFIAKQWSLGLFLAFFCFLYIGNHYKMEEQMRRIDSLNQELKSLRYEAITTSSELMYMSKQSEVLKQIKEKSLDLEELTEPPRRLKVKK